MKGINQYIEESNIIPLEDYVQIDEGLFSLIGRLLNGVFSGLKSLFTSKKEWRGDYGGYARNYYGSSLGWNRFQSTIKKMDDEQQKKIADMINSQYQYVANGDYKKYEDELLSGIKMIEEGSYDNNTKGVIIATMLVSYVKTLKHWGDYKNNAQKSNDDDYNNDVKIGDLPSKINSPELYKLLQQYNKKHSHQFSEISKVLDEKMKEYEEEKKKYQANVKKEK